MSERAGAEEEDRGILDSVRRILAQSHAEDDMPKADSLEGNGILRLDEGMMLDAEHRPVTSAEPRPAPPLPEPAATPDVPRHAATDALRRPVADDPRRNAVDLADEADPVLGDDAARSAAHSLASLRAATRHDVPRTHRGGPTIEEIVRDEIRPMLRDWLDRSLPPLVEKLVRAEISRISGLDT